MNRTDRLYAMVEELRAVSPRARSASWLAGRFVVTERTIRRDIDALQQAGVPIYAEPGRYGGYALDKTHTLPPVNITPKEAVAVAVALHSLAGSPFVDSARATLRKLVTVMPKRDVDRARELASRIHVTANAAPELDGAATAVLDAAESAVLLRTVMVIDYVDQGGAISQRQVEPLGLLGADSHWYLIAYCRLRMDVRRFRLDRMKHAERTAEVAPARPLAIPRVALPGGNPAEQLNFL